MSALYTHPADNSKSLEYEDESNYGWNGDSKYRGKNYSPRHRKYYRQRNRYNNNNNHFHNDNNNQYRDRNNYQNEENSPQYNYIKRTPNRSPRHLKARALHAVEQARIRKENSQKSPPKNTAHNDNNNNNHENDDNYKYYASPTSQAVKLPLPDTPDLYYVTNEDVNQHQHEHEHEHEHERQESEQKSYEEIEDELQRQQQAQDFEEKEVECDPDIIDLPDFQLNTEELECFQDVSVSTIHSLLDEQRLQNGIILAELHCDQEQFASVCEDYEAQNDLLKREIMKYEQENEGITDKVQMIQNILIQHKNENLIQNEEIRQSEIIKASLWEAVSTNMRLLQQVGELNGQIDCYHVLIAKTSQQLTILEKEKEAKKEKERQEITTDNNNNNGGGDNNLDGNDEKETITNLKIESKETPFDLMSVGTLNTNWFDFQSNSELDSRMDEGDILKSYADQLVSKNERYQEILKLLRNKVDELRDTRTRL